MQLTAISNEATMSSLDIALITGKEHRNVTRDISVVLSEAGIDALKFEHTYTDASNRQQRCYHLPRRECDLVISGYSVPYRLAIIDRWRELESKQSFAIPQTLPEALRLAADQAEVIERQKHSLAIAEPKAEAFHRLSEADGSICPTDAAKLLQIRPKDLFAYLDANEWTYRRAGKRERIPYQIRIQQGMMEMKAFTYHNDKTGEDEIAERALITPKGLAKLATIFGKSNAA